MKKLTFKDRALIESLLSYPNAKFASIAESLGRSTSTISREVLKYSMLKPSTNFNTHNVCALRHTCQRKNLCANCNIIHKNEYCKGCLKCNSVCKDFTKKCPKRQSPPYVCNGCDKLKICRDERFIYSAEYAQKEATKLRSESRTAVALNSPSLYEQDEILARLLSQNGHSIHAVVSNNKEKITCCEKTIYNRMHQGLYSVNLSDMPRAYKFKKRNKSVAKLPRSQQVLENRTYLDFLTHQKEHPIKGELVEMDTVIGRVGGKVLLTLQFCSSHFMLAFLLPDKSAASVVDSFYNIRLLLEKNNIPFSDVFPIILTDNGSEFYLPSDIEINKKTGKKETSIYYCTPYRSCEKPHVENNHTLLRRILPKGMSFDDLKQEDINLVLSHVNSYGRAILQNKTPFELFEFMHKDLAEVFGIKKIASNEVIMKKSLLNKKTK